MLQLRPNCECCDRDLPPDSVNARICSFECTFCRDCTDRVLAGHCPNCGGELLPRPRRPATALATTPASTNRVVKTEGCAQAPAVTVSPPATSSRRLLEIRTYRLKPGALPAFHDAMHKLSVPMLRRKGMDVVAYGRSDHEETSYFLARAYRDRMALESEQSLFYGSTEWKEGPRSILVDKIDTYLNTLLHCTEDVIEALRRLNPGDELPADAP